MKKSVFQGRKTLPSLSGLIIILCLLLNACLVGPNYREPPHPVATHWLENDTAISTTPIHQADWWEVLHDPTLTCLIEQSYQTNLSLQVAAARVLQARAQLAQSVGVLYPQQQVALGSINYNRIGGTSLQQVLPPTFGTDTFGVSANWELDFWGKYRRAIRSNDAAFLASVAAYDYALVSLISEVAGTYVSIRTTERLIQVTKQNIQLQLISLQIAKSRYRGGQTSLLDVEQAKTELSQTQANLPQQVSELRRQKDRLGVLLGTTPDQVDARLKPTRGIPHAPASIAVGIPREALAQRPDIYQARLEAVSQAEAIGAIKATLYPAFSLSGNFIFAANTINGSSLADIFNWSSRSIVAGPSFSWPILNYGQITNAVRVQDAVFQQALLNYQNLVLQAQQEVQDNITRFIEARKAQAYLTKANQSAVISYKLALKRYKEGENNYTTVLDAQQQVLRVQTSLTNATGEIAQAVVNLYRTLGGGWQKRCGHDVVPYRMKIEMAARSDWGNLLQQPNHEPPITKAQQLKQLYLPSW